MKKNKSNFTGLIFVRPLLFFLPANQQGFKGQNTFSAFSSSIVLLVVAFFFSYEAIAQSNSSAKAKEEFIKAVHDLKNIIQPKKKDSTASNQPAGSQPSRQVTIGSQTNKLKPGDALPDAKNIDADKLGNFVGGAAVITKGYSTALIDAKGNYVVPYNKYLFTNDPVHLNSHQHRVLDGFFYFNNLPSSQGGVMNAKGKIIYQGPPIDLTIDRKYIKCRHNSKQAYINVDGTVFYIPEHFDALSENTCLLQKRDNYNTKWGYKKVTGEMLTDFVYDEAWPFSDGMAVVGKKNEFGEMKYGYINRQGKLVIPFTFSVLPGNFHSGLAKVEPKNKNEFEYAFINKKGEAVLKQTLADVSRYGTFDRFTNYGLSFTVNYVLDTTLKIISKKDFMAGYGIKEDFRLINENLPVENESNPKLFFTTRTAVSPYSRLPLVGFINLGTKKAIMPCVEMVDQLKTCFDPVSHLLLAKVAIGTNNTGVVYREGYINEDGLFVMVKGSEKSTW